MCIGAFARKSVSAGDLICSWEMDGGETGIRTLENLAALLVFETSPFDHSGISPLGGTRAGVSYPFRAAASTSRQEKSPDGAGACAASTEAEVAPRAGLEPATKWLTATYSTS